MDYTRIIVRGIFENKWFSGLVSEWVRHIEKREEPSALVNMYLCAMNSETDMDSRRATSNFSGLMKTRDWGEMRDLMSPYVGIDGQMAFQAEYSAEFYETFKKTSLKSIRDYYEAGMKDSAPDWPLLRECLLLVPEDKREERWKKAVEAIDIEMGRSQGPRTVAE